jgi:hypothetical protein
MVSLCPISPGSPAPYDDPDAVQEKEAARIDPAALREDLPNLERVGRDDCLPGPADAFHVGLLLQGEPAGDALYQANGLVIRGVLVFVGDAPARTLDGVYLPLVLRSRCDGEWQTMDDRQRPDWQPWRLRSVLRVKQALLSPVGPQVQG